ncbi:MAG TPA: ATP-binding protein [Beijerinckiaceae bacterium]|nr:ATP-binding protein [Beijerinckiaceae bacterium]
MLPTPARAPRAPLSLQMVLAASVLVPLGLFALGAWQSHRQLYSQAERDVRRQAVMLKEHASKVLKANQVVMEQVNQRVRGLSWDEIKTSRTLWDDLKAIDSDLPQIDSIFMVDPSGVSALTTRVFPSPSVDFSDRDYFLAQRDGPRNAYVSGSYVGKISRRRIFNQSIARDSGKFAFDGVIGVSAYVEDLESFYSVVARPEENASVALLRADGQVLARYPASINMHAQEFASALPASGIDEAIAYTRPDADASRRLVGYAKAPDFDVYVAYGTDEGVLRSAWYGYLVQWGILALLAAAAMSGLAWLVVRRTWREAMALQQWAATYDELAREISRREEAEAQLVQTQKLEALGQLTGGVAHDFNNLLQILSGHLGRLKARVADERSRRALSYCEAAIEKGEKLIAHLLAFARRQPLRYEVFDLNACLGAMDGVLHQATTGVVIETELSSDLWPVVADPTQLELAVLNLVVNARDAMPDGGTIRVTTANRRLGSGDGELPGEFVTCTVSDDGPGIPADVLARVWEPFFTTKPAGKGTGLGLSMVYGFARQSGGFARIVSEVGRGTSVTIFLPKGSPTSAYGSLPAAQSEPSKVVPFRRDR